MFVKGPVGTNLQGRSSDSPLLCSLVTCYSSESAHNILFSEAEVLNPVCVGENNGRCSPLICRPVGGGSKSIGPS